MMQFRSPPSSEPEINLIPFIDVLLVVIIFLVLTTTYARFTGLQIQLPSASADTPVSEPTEITVFIDGIGNYELGGSVYGLKDLTGLRSGLQERLFAQQDAEKAILVIYADTRTPHQAVLSVMDEARKVNISRITFAAQNDKKP